MILTVTLNTSIDKAYVVENFKTGDVARVKQAAYTAGGKGINVARVIAVLGEEVMATGFIGGFSGGFVEHELSKKKIPHEFVRIEGETRSCVNVIDEATRVHTELLEPGPFLTSQDVERFITLYEILLQRAGVITMSGSAPRGVDIDIYKTLIEMARNHGKEVILDTSGCYLKEGIKAFPTMIKPNMSEAESILGRKISGIEDAARAVRELADSGARYAAVSMGKNGAVLAEGKSGRVCWVKPPEITPVNIVGCGDAMVAGFAVALSKGYDIETMLRLAVATSAASALVPETGGCRKGDVEEIYKKILIPDIKDRTMFT